MKKVFLVMLALFAVIAGCADSNHNGTVSGGNTNNKDVPVSEISTMTAQEAMIETAKRLYFVADLSPEAQQTILMLFDAFMTGKYNDLPLNSSKPGGIGQVTSPYVASSIVQLFFHYASGATVPGIIPDPDNPFKEMLYYNNLTDPAVLAASLQKIYDMDPVKYATIEGAFKLIVDSQDNITEIVKAYESRLLDSASSASKTSGGGGTIITDGYQVSANIAYVISLFPILGKEALSVSRDEIEQTAKALYDFNEASKLKVTYDKALFYFNPYEIASEIQVNTILIPVLSDMIKSETPGGTPILDVDDNVTFLNPYADNTTDYYLLDNITKKLYGVPDKKYISKAARNRVLEFHQELRKYGMKLPKGKTSDIGIDSIAEIIGQYLRENGYVYNSLFYTALGNVTPGFNTKNSDGYFKPYVIDKVFDTTTNGVNALGCQIIREVNQAVDDSAKAYSSNTGYYAADVIKDSNPCGLTIDPAYVLPGN